MIEALIIYSAFVSTVYLALTGYIFLKAWKEAERELKETRDADKRAKLVGFICKMIQIQ